MYFDQLKSGVRVQIVLPGHDSSNSVMCKIEVAVPERKELLVHAPSEKYAAMPKGGGYSIRTLTDNAIYVFRATMLSVGHVDGFKVIRFLIEDNGEKTQRRNAYRFTCAIPITFTVVDATGGQSENAKGIVTDLSAGGIKLATDLHLKNSDLLNISLDLDGETVVAFGDVRSKTELPRTAKHLFQYGIRFPMIPQTDQEKIIKHVTKLQREELKKVRG